MAERHAHVRAGEPTTPLHIGMEDAAGLHLEPANPKAVVVVKRKVTTYEVVFNRAVPVDRDGYVNLHGCIPLNDVGEYVVSVDLSFDSMDGRRQHTSLDGSVTVE